MIPKQIYIQYAINDSNHFFTVEINSPENEISREGLKIHYSYKNNRFSLCFVPEGKVQIKQVKLSGNLETVSEKNTRYFLNGYQSWTDSREYSKNEMEKTIGHMPKFINKKYGFAAYGDYNFYGAKLGRGSFHGWTYAYVRNENDFEFAGSLSELSGKDEERIFGAEKSFSFALIKFFTKENRFEVFADADGIDYEITSPQIMLDMVFLSGSEDSVFDSYFEIAGIEKPKAAPVMGWTSWYDYYQRINEKCLLKNIGGLSKSVSKTDGAFKVFQIDDGYEKFVGDWLDCDYEKFHGGLEPVVKAAVEAGMKTGIWFAPFSAEKKSEIFQTHPDWFVKDINGEPVLCGCNWSGFYGMDIYNDEVRDYIKKACRHFIDDLGFTLLKIDFLYSVCLVPQKNKTRGKIMHDALEFFREVSKGAELLGCGVPLGSAFGLVDYCRIGTDVSLSWNDKLYMQLCHRERPSTKNTILNSLYRRQLDARAFLNDPDVFLLRTYNEKLGKNRKELLSEINALAGSLIFTSDNPETYNESQNEELRKIILLSKAQINSVENRGNLVTVSYCYKDQDNSVDEKTLSFNKKNGKIVR